MLSTNQTNVSNASAYLIILLRLACALPLALLSVPAAHAGDECQPQWVTDSACLPGLNGTVYTAAVWDDGTGKALYVGGSFTIAGCTQASNIARWDGSSWQALGAGINYAVVTLSVFDDGSGSALYAGGGFWQAGPSTANRIARWDGSTWSPLGSGMNDWVRSLAVFDDGSGPALYAGGSFTHAGGSAANRIARWDGSTWSPLGSGINGDVYALTAFSDTPTGEPALYAGGFFTQAGGTPANAIARWNGSAWSPLGSGMSNGFVLTLTAFDDGSGGGPVLHAGGFFTHAGGTTANSIARWNGSAWSPLASGMNERVRSLSVFDDGSGPALYAGGQFTLAGGSPANTIARWDGSAWSPLGSGFSGSVNGILPSVRTLSIFDTGQGPTLYAGGTFTQTGQSPAYHFAHWLPRPPCPADLNNDCALDFFDVSAFLAAFSASDPIADFNSDGNFDFFDALAYLTAFGAGCP
ncbi:MAG: hypothetical protein KF757_08920 [Phycisphaeraceae bacterium]|nr:hypothetical protein [Phycisphaeraceae bacterium]MCW5762876.1 hypothetical protein [Phycisphaeraceae bacterium]